MTNTPFTPKLKQVLIVFNLNRFCKTPVHINVKHVNNKTSLNKTTSRGCFNRVLIKTTLESIRNCSHLGNKTNIEQNLFDRGTAIQSNSNNPVNNNPII